MANGMSGARGLRLAACTLFLVIAGCATSPTTRLADLAGLQQRADSAYAHHDWQGAAAAYHSLAQAVPGNAAYWFRLGNSYARLDQPQPAVAAYRAALQRNPHLAPAWHNLGAVLLQQAQAAFGEAASNAASSDPLKSGSALLAERVRAVRRGGSMTAPDPSHAADPPQQARPEPSTPSETKGGG